MFDPSGFIEDSDESLCESCPHKEHGGKKCGTCSCFRAQSIDCRDCVNIVKQAVFGECEDSMNPCSCGSIRKCKFHCCGR